MFQSDTEQGPNEDRRARINQRLRHAFIDGAEEDSRPRLGRGLSREELERVLRRYPGGPLGPTRPVVPTTKLAQVRST